MTFEEWISFRAAREAIENAMIALARQIAGLPEGNPARAALDGLFQNLMAIWQQIDDKLKAPAEKGPIIKAAPPPPPPGTWTPEERERMREAAEHLQHALYELMQAMKR